MGGHSSQRQLRLFGFTIGAFFLAIGILPLLLGAPNPRWWSLVVCFTLLLAGLVVPDSLRKPYRLWLGFADGLGWINSRVILALLFFVVFLPVGFLMRLVGFDPMNRTFLPNAGSYRVPRQQRRPSHMEHYF